MRVFEGARDRWAEGRTLRARRKNGIVRPILDVWERGYTRIPKETEDTYRIDRSNVDTRFERNWVRHVLIPLLEKRYGKSIKKRIFTLGERFRELDAYLEAEAGRWIRRNVKTCIDGCARSPTATSYSGEKRSPGFLPSCGSRSSSGSASIGSESRRTNGCSRRWTGASPSEVLRARERRQRVETVQPV